MVWEKIYLEDSLFNTNIDKLSKENKLDIENRFKKEMTEIFIGKTV